MHITRRRSLGGLVGVDIIETVDALADASDNSTVSLADKVDLSPLKRNVGDQN